MASHLICILLVGMMVYTAQPGTSLFSWHPTCMTIGIGFFLFEALLLFNKQSSLVDSSARSTKVTYHWLLHVIGLIMLVFGFLVIFRNKMITEKPHFTTWHGLFGVITVSYAMVQAVAGILVKYCPKSFRLANMKLYHATSGSVMFCCGCTSLALGMYSTWFQTNAGEFVWYACIICSTLMALIITKQVTDNYMPLISNRARRR